MGQKILPIVLIDPKVIIDDHCISLLLPRPWRSSWDSKLSWKDFSRSIVFIIKNYSMVMGVFLQVNKWCRKNILHLRVAFSVACYDIVAQKRCMQHVCLLAQATLFWLLMQVDEIYFYGAGDSAKWVEIVFWILGNFGEGMKDAQQFIQLAVL